MTFVSALFIGFVAAVALVYFLFPKRFRWVVLLAASYTFFFFNSEWLVLVLLLTTAVTFFTGHAIYKVNTKGKQALKEKAASLTSEEKKAFKSKTKKKAKLVMLAGVVVVLFILLFLKYYNFFSDNANHLLQYCGFTLPKLHLLLPIGISFYTLQAIAYMVDIYRNKCEPDKNFLKFMLFMSFFPQIVQGPIARHNQLAHQLYEGHSFDYNRLCMGAQLIMWGWIKKMVIADRLGVFVDQIFNNSGQYTGLIVFMAVAGYGIQIYADFSGGMDIARGVSQILGIELELNFRQPYFSRSIEDFWRRWHIALGGWMRDYVFYPLSLSKAFANLSKKSRKVLGAFVGKRLPSFLAMFIVYFLVGFWHGSSWKYIAYGIWNGVFIVAGILLSEILYDKVRIKLGIEAESVSWRVFQMIRTFLLCSFGRFFSRADSLMTALRMMKSMFIKIYDLSFLTDGSLLKLGLSNASWILLLFSILVLFFVDYLHEKDVPIRETIARQSIIFRWIIYYGAIIAILVFGIYGPGYDAASFIYEQF